jgi:anaerobic magnesium-protoporphyrin IX monomethyl ester cyclase
MVDILFGQSYFLRFDPKLWAAAQPYPPLGTMYAASYARSKGYSVALFDAMLAESEAEWGAALQKYQPRFACLFEDNFNYLSKMCLLRMREAALTMIDLAKRQGCTVILCGADATDHAELYLQHAADYVLLGEGELTLGELLDSLTSRSSQPPASISGLAYSTPAITRNPRRPDLRDLDSLPFPAWDLVDVPRYQKLWRDQHGYYSMNLVTTRGCPYSCNWCAKPIWGQRYNSRSPQNVAAEIKWLKDTYHPDHLWFADDILGLKPSWIENFARLLKETDSVVPFKCLQRADLVSEPIAAALAQAGCRTVWLGAESGSQKILDAMDKGDQVADIRTATRRLQTVGIEVGFFLQFGYPGESWDDIQLTLKMVRDCAPDDIGISVSYPLPGTKFFERVKLELGQKQNWTDSNDLAMLYHGPFPTEFYRILHSRIHHEFRLRRAWQQKRWATLARAPYYLFGLAQTELRLRRMAARPQSALPVLDAHA